MLHFLAETLFILAGSTGVVVIVQSLGNRPVTDAPAPRRPRRRSERGIG